MCDLIDNYVLCMTDIKRTDGNSIPEVWSNVAFENAFAIWFTHPTTPWSYMSISSELDTPVLNFS